MSEFTCPVATCNKELSRLQVMHFRSAHDCDPVEWVQEQYGATIRTKYEQGLGSYSIASEYDWLSSEMVCEVVDTRTHNESLSGEQNPMRRPDVVSQFIGEANPAKREEVRDKISEALTGREMSDEAKEKISQKNSGNEVSEAHRKKISEASSNRDTSYMQSEEYSKALSEGLRGREPTYPTPYDVDSLSHQVRSSWEEEIAKMLEKNNISYVYEEEFELSVGSYYLDFLVDQYAIEVKGFSNERSVTKATAFVREFPGYTYVVVGDKIPCNIHIPWPQRSELLEVLNDE